MIMESPATQQNGELLDAVSECTSIDVVGETPVGRNKKVKIVDPWEFLDSLEEDDSSRESHPQKLMTMESPASQQSAESLDAVSECTSMDVVSKTPVGRKKKVKIVEPWELLDSLEEGDCRRERHPHKNMLKELSSEDSAVPETMQLCTVENGIQSNLRTMAYPPQWHPLSAVIPTCNPGPNGMQGLPAFSVPDPGAPDPYVGLAGNGIPFFIPGSGVFVPAATGEMPAHQIHTPGSGFSQGIVVAASSTSLHVPQQIAEEATRKRELRLMKNREAARECRKKKKEYVKCLENRVAVLENQNKTLIEELKALKDLYCHKAEEAAKACRLRRKEYIRCLESHNAFLEMHNQQLLKELDAYRNLYRNSSCRNSNIP